MTQAEDAEKRKSGAGSYDPASIEKICNAPWEPLSRFIYYQVCNRQEAEDITQETYVRALPTFRNSGITIRSYGSYLKAVAVNVIRDRWRRAGRRGTQVNIDKVNPAEMAVEDSTESSMQREIIRDALNQLNERHRQVIELRILKGYSVAEAAQIMDETEGNIRVLQYRALQALAKILKIINERRENDEQ
jgi:RNA polymerase sigma-70 factor (ECF subfamily)